MRDTFVERASSFFLYGEPVREVEQRFVHIETLDKRTRPPDWRIQPHVHVALSQVFALARGGGRMVTDGAETAFQAPCVLLMPPRTVHSFSFDHRVAGYVVTIGEQFLLDLTNRAPALARLFDGPKAIRLGSHHESRQLDLILRQLSVETDWDAPAHDAALDVLLTMTLILVLRALSCSAIDESNADRDVLLVARFRQLVEVNFRKRPQLELYLYRLKVSESQLRRACARVVRQPPLQIIQERTVLEAKRMLLYSSSTAEEISFRLGFSDPAYFSRFFRLATGMTARVFRNQGERRN